MDNFNKAQYIYDHMEIVDDCLINKEEKDKEEEETDNEEIYE